jgi:DNA-binding GntR family transcriptional regulator
LTKNAILAPKEPRPAERRAATPSAAETASSPDKVVTAIYRGILAGRIVPGQKLIEADLAATLGVSRGPIREALKRLHAEGVVENTRHRGAYVRILSRQEAFDFLEVLTLLTSFIARKAAEVIAQNADDLEKAHESDLATLRHFLNVDRADQLHLETNRRFYDALISIGGNSQIASIMPVMRIQLFRMQGHTTASPQAQQQRIAEFSEVARHVLAGDAAGSQKAMGRHMRLTLKRLESLPDEAFAGS